MGEDWYPGTVDIGGGLHNEYNRYRFSPGLTDNDNIDTGNLRDKRTETEAAISK